MIWQLLEILANPSAFAATIKNGEIHIASLADLETAGRRVR